MSLPSISVHICKGMDLQLRMHAIHIKVFNLLSNLVIINRIGQTFAQLFNDSRRLVETDYYVDKRFRFTLRFYHFL